MTRSPHNTFCSEMKVVPCTNSAKGTVYNLKCVPAYISAVCCDSFLEDKLEKRAGPGPGGEKKKKKGAATNSQLTLYLSEQDEVATFSPMLSSVQSHLSHGVAGVRNTEPSGNA